MSALGQEWTLRHMPMMSALPPKADITHRSERSLLFDHLVGELQEMLGNVEPKRFCGLEIDDKLKLDWRLCGEFGRLLALQNTIDI